MTFENWRDVFRALRSGKYAWPGGYPTFFWGVDGSTYSFDAVRADPARFARDTRDGGPDALEGFDVNWESEMFCDDTGRQIEAAYADRWDENGSPIS